MVDVSTQQSPDFAGANLAATALLDYDINHKQWLALQPNFREWIGAVIGDHDYQELLPHEVMKRWGSGWTRNEEIIDVSEYADYAQEAAGRHATAVIQLALQVALTRQVPDQNRVEKLLGAIVTYRAEVDEAAAVLAEAEQEDAASRLRDSC